MLSIATLWIPFTITAALGQVARNAMQRQLTGPLGTWGATNIRFLFGFPFSLVFFAVVIAAELFNTTLEVLIDYAWPEHHPMIGRAKDVAAAAVLVAACATALVGALLFARHIFHLL